ncbi:enoyl-CoA hydratase [Amorphus suaedae]
MSDEVVFERHGHTGLVILNRPKALNALTHEMVRAMYATLNEWANDPLLRQVIVTAAGDRAFCAGGDIRYIWGTGRERHAEAVSFFRDEYRLNVLIKRFPKPYIALIDGICMGGGVGVSVHGSHRVATERTVFAMPETGIGFFPDVGGSYILSRMPAHSGMYAGLTAARLGQADCLWAGLATHAVESASLGGIKERLLAGAELEKTLAEASVALELSPLQELESEIAHFFAKPSLEEILTALAGADAGMSWARETLRTLRERAPSSLAITFNEIRLARDLSFEECMAMEYRIVSRILQHDDFYEGVRAVLVDKDGAPKWRPERVEDLDPAVIAEHFEPLGTAELRFD